MSSARLAGVLSPVVTPFGPGGAPDVARWTRHCRWLLDSDVGLAIFGTNSEANSLGVGEKRALLAQAVEAGLDPARMMPGTGMCAAPDTIALTKDAVALGCGGVLMLPPFYYKGVSDDGLYAYFSDVIQGVGDDRLRLYLYHIPPVAQVGVSLDLIDRLLTAYPGVIAGVKDSSGDVANLDAMLERFQPRGFDVFAGSEALLLRTMRGGGAGCISATANVNPAPIAALARDAAGAGADAAQAALTATRGIFQKHPMIPALKATIARVSGDAGWAAVRPPLTPLSAEQTAALAAELDAAGFAMPGLVETA